MEDERTRGWQATMLPHVCQARLPDSRTANCASSTARPWRRVQGLQSTSASVFTKRLPSHDTAVYIQIWLRPKTSSNSDGDLRCDRAYTTLTRGTSASSGAAPATETSVNFDSHIPRSCHGRFRFSSRNGANAIGSCMLSVSSMSSQAVLMRTSYAGNTSSTVCCS